MSGRTDGRAVCLFLALISLTVLFGPSIARAQQIVGAVTELSGSAQIQRTGAIIAVVQGMPVQLHDRIITSPNSDAVVTLSSGITLTLGEHTNLSFDQNVASVGAPAPNQLNMLQGALRSVVPVLQPTQSFEVHTPNASTAVRGTDFDVTYIEGRVRPGYGGCQRYTDVRVRDGVVAVSNLSSPTQVVEIEAGFETTVPCLLPPLTAGPLGIAGAVGPGGAAGRSSHSGGAAGGTGGGAAGGAAAAAVGFAAPPPGTGSSAPPPPPPPPASLSPTLGP